MLINKIKKMLSIISANREVSDTNSSQGDSTSTLTGGARVREKAYFNEDTLQQQRLYEKWVCKDYWLLQSEGIPLLLGKDPECGADADHIEQYDQSYNDLWEHASHCVMQNLLQVANSGNLPEEWKVRPADLYRWASIGRISVPEHFGRLMEFVLHTVKPASPDISANKTNNPVPGGNEPYTEVFGDHRERVLGAALAIIAKYPDECRDKKGRVRPDLIIKILGEKKNTWFGDDKLLLSPPAMKDLLEKYLHSV